jgi:DNA-binding response OmpR family regulator
MKMILLVEDSLDLADVIIRELETAGYRVLHAADGVTGLALHTQHSPDLVVLEGLPALT